MKSKVYENKPETLDELEANIQRIIGDITPAVLNQVIENWTPVLEHVRVSRGEHMPKIIFKK